MSYENVAHSLMLRITSKGLKGALHRPVADHIIQRHIRFMHSITKQWNRQNYSPRTYCYCKKSERILSSFMGESKRTFSLLGDQSPIRSQFTPKMFILVLIPIITFGLGTWQVKRLSWKVDLINRVNEQIQKTPLILPKQINLDILDEFEYRKVVTSGTFRHDQEILVGPRTREGVNGYHIVTPLEREEGSKILVNRGWIPQERKDQSSRVKGLPTDKQEVVGLIRVQEKKSIFTPQNRPDVNQFHYINIGEFANLTQSQPLLIDETNDAGLSQNAQYISDGHPIGRSSNIEIRNTHLSYAITWYALSVATSIMLYQLLRRPTIVRSRGKR